MNHADQAVERLSSQFRAAGMGQDTNNIEEFLRALVDPFQDVEDTLWQLFTERTIMTAVGAQLDVIGRIVGFPRNTTDDDLYRLYLLGQIKALRSRGTINDLVELVQLMLFGTTGQVHLTEYFPAAVIIFVDSTVVTPDLALAIVYFLKIAKGAGVRVFFEYAMDPNGQLLRFDSNVVGQRLDEGHMVPAVEV